MKRLLGALSVALLCACSTAATDDEDDFAPVTVAAPAPATDPRVAELQVVVAELLDRLEVMNARIHKLESGAPPARIDTVARREDRPATAATVTPAAATVTQQRPARRATTRAQQPPTREPATAGSALAQRYRSGLELFGKGQIDQARIEFQAIFDSDPNGELADNALYWVGETYYLTGRYADAMKFYQRVLTDFSDQNKAPDAMLKIGLSYAKLGDLALARKMYQELIAKYPYSTPAAAAKYELKRIQY